jgi:hypothetical protein
MNPNFTEMESYLKKYIGEKLIPPRNDKSTAFQYVQVAPFEMGRINLPATYLGQPSPWLQNSGKDYLTQNPGHVERFGVVLGNWPRDTAIGPFHFLAGSVGVAVFRAVFVDKRYNLTDPSMGMPWRQGMADQLAKWPRGDPNGQFWGHVIVNLDFENIFEGTDPDLALLSESGYVYSLWQSGEYAEVLDASIPRVDITNLTSHEELSRKEAISVAFDIVEGNTWHIDVARRDVVWGSSSSWTPSWYLPLMIGLPFVCIILGLVLLVLLLLMLWSAEHEKHVRLLKSLIPADVLEGRLGSLCINDANGVSGVNIVPVETPAEKILNLLAQLLRGQTPSMEDVLEVREAMTTSDSVHRRPIGLEAALTKHLDREVAASLLALVDETPRLGTQRSPEAIGSPELPKQAPWIGCVRRSESGTLEDAGKVQTLLQEACTNWYFDIFELQAVTHGCALSSLAFYLLTTNTDVAAALQLDLRRLAKFLSAIEAQYSSEAQYHSAVHGADVLQSFALMCSRVLIPRGYVDTPLVHLACIIAAVVHDVDHKGVNNDFLVNSRDPLALLYNDFSPMESYHCSVAFRTLYQEDCDFMSHLPAADRKAFRHLVIRLVLATDMKQHFAIVSKFCAKHRLGPAPSAAVITDSGLLEVVTAASDGPPPLDDAEKLLSLQMALKMSDIRATSMPMPIAERWVMRLQEEFFAQGDRELALGLQISPLSDRRNASSGGMSKSQTGFYEFIALPLVYNMLHVFPEIRDGPLNGFRLAYLEWKARQQQQHLPTR